jgi:leader peptidase (prepilin peptidase)/N-methyltransferase
MLQLAAAGGVFGTLIGSFLNVVVHRVPLGLSVVAPPSACPACAARIRPFDNVPVLSWLLLRGRCRDCRSPISTRYPLVELLTGLFFAGVVARFLPVVLAAPTLPALAAAAVVLAAFLYLAAISTALALIDLDTKRLPNPIVLPAYLLGGVLFGAAALLGGDGGSALRALAGAAVLGSGYLALALARPGGMGFGDVKLAGALGLFLGWLGWPELAIGTFAAFLLGGMFAVALLALGRARRTTGIPFGPWMLAGAWTAVFAGEPLWTSYLRLVGLG